MAAMLRPEPPLMFLSVSHANGVRRKACEVADPSWKPTEEGKSGSHWAEVDRIWPVLMWVTGRGLHLHTGAPKGGHMLSLLLESCLRLEHGRHWPQGFPSLVRAATGSKPPSPGQWTRSRPSGSRKTEPPRPQSVSPALATAHPGGSPAQWQMQALKWGAGVCGPEPPDRSPFQGSRDNTTAARGKARHQDRLSGSGRGFWGAGMMREGDGGPVWGQKTRRRTSQTPFHSKILWDSRGSCFSSQTACNEEIVLPKGKQEPAHTLSRGGGGSSQREKFISPIRSRVSLWEGQTTIGPMSHHNRCGTLWPELICNSLIFNKVASVFTCLLATCILLVNCFLNPLPIILWGGLSSYFFRRAVYILWIPTLCYMCCNTFF